MTKMNRRRFLTIAAASLALPKGALAAESATWRGQAMGAPTVMTLAGISATQAAPIFVRVEQELLRLEGIFSLYRESELVRLNSDARLAAPSAELLEVLSLSDGLWRASGGVFDPSVQPLWLARAGLSDRTGPMGWGNLRFDARKIEMKPGMALTLNGIAQGYITDRIAALLQSEGLRDVLMDMGEVAAMGTRADGSVWRAGVATPEGEVVHRLTLRDRALATSAPTGTMVGKAGHIMNPNGTPPTRNLVAVSAPRAVLADGLSTALCLLPPAEGDALVARYPGAKIEIST